MLSRFQIHQPIGEICSERGVSCQAAPTATDPEKQNPRAVHCASHIVFYLRQLHGSPVSHALSERMSRTPIARSERGPEKMIMPVVFRKNGRKVTARDIQVSLFRAVRSSASPRGWDKDNSCMDRQTDSILGTDWTAAFEKQRMSFGKVDASCLIRRAFGSLRSAV